ncbi:hypothetical protein WN944_004188 [Citrus x changshan-huyou]|uniref:Serine-threonine/tyrosine-protein kinase catalytic domain-containing protein n=1 Tax=Citrus x changshan-huyou TaxID=2935761 RepID=A0AAP0M1E2_9ROSI
MSRRVSILRDIYSYGIVLLETFTGKRPTDDMFNDDFRIHVFCVNGDTRRVMDILDPSMPLHEENDEEQIEEGIKEKAVVIDIRH